MTQARETRSGIASGGLELREGTMSTFSTPTPAVAGRQVRMRIEAERLRLGESREQLAKALDWSGSKVWRIENGRSLLSTTDLRALLQHFTVDESEWAHLVELARISRQATLGSHLRDVADKHYSELVELEQFATHIRWYETTYIPGVLQTSEYARSVIRGLAPNMDLTRVEKLVQLRLGRAEHLMGVSGPILDFLIDESALRRAVGSRDHGSDNSVMLEMLDKLRRFNTVGNSLEGKSVPDDLNPNISIRVVPMEVGVYSALRGPFELVAVGLSGHGNIVFEENYRGDKLFHEGEVDLSSYASDFADAEKLALGPEETNHFFDRLSESVC